MNRAKINNLIVYLLIGTSIVLFGFRLFDLINRHAVNILFFDQWDFLSPLFENPTAWEMFTRQHGPHRQGLGLFVSKAVGIATDWNTRAECFTIGFILILVTLLALLLKKRLFGKLTVWDVLIPSITLSFTQIEAASMNPNPAHGALPILMVVISGLLLTLENKYIRYFGLVFITFFATYTGFGFFLGLAIPVILLICFLLHRANKEKPPIIIAGIAFLLSIISFASFFIGYVFDPVAGCFQLSIAPIIDYLSFISLELTTFVGFASMYEATFAKILGFLLFLIMTGVVLSRIYRLQRDRKDESKHLVIFLFISFSLLFAANSALGRFCHGMEAAQTSRYMTLLIPGWLGLYFAAQNLSRKYIQAAANIILAVLFIILPTQSYRNFDDTMNSYSQIKKRWAACYIENESIANCDKAAGHPIYPAPEATDLKRKLDLLEEKQLNLFIKQ